MLDLVFAVVILIVALAVVLSNFTTVTSNGDLYDTNRQILKGITQTRINDLNSNEVRQLFIQNKIRNIENTVAEQISEYYYTKDYLLAQNITRIFVKDYVASSMNINVTITDNLGETQLYAKLNNRRVQFSQAGITSVSKRIIFGSLNQTSFYGPYTITIKLWA